MNWEDFTLISEPSDPGALYDRFGNRYRFHDHTEYLIARNQQIISWIHHRAPLYFL